MLKAVTYLALLAGIFTLGFGVIQFTPLGASFSITAVSAFLVLAGISLLSVTYLSFKAGTRVDQKMADTEDLEAEREAALAESKAKTRFLANISHELRTPLNAIIGFSDLLKDEVMGPLGNPQYVQYVGDIHTSGVHLLGIINDILDFSKAEAGKLEMNVIEVDVTKLTRNAIRMVSPRADEAGVELVESMPDEHIVLPTDGKRFKQIMLNLLSNAVKFTDEGGKVYIDVKDMPENDAWQFSVRDTGVGIAEKDVDKVFKSFGQVDNELSRKYEGTGLGLPLTKLLAELLGGELVLTSILGEGTTVTVTLPKQFSQEEVGEADLMQNPENAQDQQSAEQAVDAEKKEDTKASAA